MVLGGWDYAAALVGSLALTLLFTPLCLRYAHRHRLFDHPAPHKSQGSPVPYLGGVAMVVAFSAALLGVALFHGPRSSFPELALIVGLGILLSAVGLADDLWQVSPWLRLAVEAGAGLALWFGGVRTLLTGQPIVDGVMTVCWVVVVTNAVNLLDNTDGLSAGVATIAALFFFVIAATNHQFLVAGLSIALAGCAGGFLRSNFYPARMYMGDAGSLFIGFILAVIGIKLRFDGPTQVTFFVPVLVLGVALFDTALVITNRLAHGRSPLLGGRDHASHRLVAIGVPVPFAVVLTYVGGASLGWLGLVMSQVDRNTGFLLMGWTLAVAVLFGLLLSAVPVYDTSRRRRLVLQEVPPAEWNPQLPTLPGSGGRPATPHA